LTLHLTPEVVPCVAIRPLEPSRDDSSFGLFATERKARNMLSRLAREYRLCHRVLGIAAGTKAPCLACPGDVTATSCLGPARSKNELAGVIAALWPMRIPPWPHRGPVGIRERSDLHVVDQWQFLGTARCESEVHELLEGRVRAFDPRLYRLLRRTFSRLPAERIIDLYECSVRPHRAASASINGSAHP
jgi:DNA polymerase-3 subunit epsilon